MLRGFLLASTLLIAPAWADGLSAPLAIPQNAKGAAMSYPPQASGGGSPTYTALTAPACQNIAFGSATATFSAASIGVGFNVFGVFMNNAVPITSASINGNTASLVVQDSGDNFSVISAANASGTTGNIVINATGSTTTINSICIAGGYFTNLSSTTPTTSGAVPYGFTASPTSYGSSITVPSSGFVFIMGGLFNDGVPFSWTNAVRDSVTEQGIASTLSIAAAHMTATGTPSMGWTGGTSPGVGFAMAGWH